MAKRTSPSSSRTTKNVPDGAPADSFANVVALIALFLAFVFAAQLAGGVAAVSYGQWLGGAVPTPGVLQSQDAWMSLLRSIEQSGFGSGLARGILLVLSGGIGLVALASANRGALRVPALVFAWAMVVIAATLLALASIKFNRAGIGGLTEYAGYIATSGVLAVLAAAAAALIRAFNMFRVFPMAFVLVLLLHLALMAFSGINISGSFAGNLGLIVWLGILMLGFAYARQLARPVG